MKNLLHKINLILQEEKVLKEEKLRRGEEFNIFEVMRAESYEVRTHSAFIAELLNPKGKHGQGDAFLKLFLDTIQESLKENSVPYAEMFNAFDVYTHTYVEYNIGPISANKEEGGRIDILLKGKGKAIIIENKIYAGDQEKQLCRYRKFAQRQYGEGNYLILYLTLDGHSPDGKSLMGTDKTLAENEDYFCINYKHHICDWLSLCKEKATAAPLVRETITQYYNLITKLTYQDMEITTKKNLTDLLAEPENIGALFAVEKVHDTVLDKICNKALRPQVKKIADELKSHETEELECVIEEQSWHCQYSHFSFRKSSWKRFCIMFEFMKPGLCDFNYCIRYIEEQDMKDKKYAETKEKLTCIKGISNAWKSNDWWPCFKAFSYGNWNDAEVLKRLYCTESIENVKSIKDLIKENVEELLKYISQYEIEM